MRNIHTCNQAGNKTIVQTCTYTSISARNFVTKLTSTAYLDTDIPKYKSLEILLHNNVSMIICENMNPCSCVCCNVWYLGPENTRRIRQWCKVEVSMHDNCSSRAKQLAKMTKTIQEQCNPQHMPKKTQL
jgi:hypothetical protein